MAETLRPDICVIGGGSGGLSVAAAAAAFGVSVVLIEKGRMGGDCLNYGCVPSKALIAAAKHAHAVRQAACFGVFAGDPVVDFKAVHDHVHGVIGAIAPNDSVARFTGLGVRVIQAEARFKNRRTVTAGDLEIRARRFVVATGSSPLVPPIPGLDEVPYLTNESVWDLTRLPSSLIVVGGGPIGLELAQAFNRLGSSVTVLEAARALGNDDPELAAVVLKRIRAEGVGLREGATVTKVARHGRHGVRVTVETGSGSATVDGGALLIAVGRRATVDGLDLDKAGIRTGTRGIAVDARLRTRNSRVYAVGDVAGSYQFTHWAGYHASLVVRSILFRFGGRVNDDIVTWATYTDPELAHVGLSEADARKRHGRINVLRWPYAENDRAQTERATGGHVKVVTTKKGVIVGAAIVGRNASELLGLWALAVGQKLDVRALTGLVLPYPTLSETAKRAAVTYYLPKLGSPWLKRTIRFLRVFG